MTRWPLMKDNVTREDLDAVRVLLDQDDPVLTQGPNVRAFEQEWSAWLGVKHSVFVNSGSSANLLTLAALRELHGAGGEVIVPTITWVSDVAAVLHCGFEPVFVDVNPRTLGMDPEQALRRVGPHTRAVFLTHVLGYNALTNHLRSELIRQGIPLLEDVCESHGATFMGKKLGTFGLASNFSFYYAHHLSTVEGGMVCTNDADLYEAVRMLRGHGMVREMDSDSRKREWASRHMDLSPDFIFVLPGYNVRSTEMNAVIGRSQLRRLDDNIKQRNENLKVFLGNLDPDLYFTDFDTAGCSNYALTLVLRKPNPALCVRVIDALRANGVEFRRGTAGGGNQVRQPYLRRTIGYLEWRRFPRADHVHFYGFYVGNHPALDRGEILWLCELLNGLKEGA